MWHLSLSHHAAGCAQRFGIFLLVLRVLDGLMMAEGVDVWCKQQLAACPGKELTQCSKYPCAWDHLNEQCVASMPQGDCVKNGDLYNNEHAILPQLLAQLFYCWLLAAYTTNTKSAALLVADDGTVPPCKSIPLVPLPAQPP